jgi:hypothetical protein
MEDFQKVHNMLQLLYTNQSRLIKDDHERTMVVSTSVLTEEEQARVKLELFKLLGI